MIDERPHQDDQNILRDGILPIAQSYKSNDEEVISPTSPQTEPELKSDFIQFRSFDLFSQAQPHDENIAAANDASNLIESVEKERVDSLDLIACLPTKRIDISNIDPRLRDSLLDTTSDPVKVDKSQSNKDPVLTSSSSPEIEQAQPSLTRTSSMETVTLNSTIKNDQNNYFKIVDICAQFRQLFDVAIKLHMMCREQANLKPKVNQTMLMMNDINRERQPYMRRLTDLGRNIEPKVGRWTWSFIKASRVSTPEFAHELDVETRVWKWKLNVIDGSAS